MPHNRHSITICMNKPTDKKKRKIIISTSYEDMRVVMSIKEIIYLKYLQRILAGLLFLSSFIEVYN